MKHTLRGGPYAGYVFEGGVVRIPALAARDLEAYGNTVANRYDGGREGGVGGHEAVVGLHPGRPCIAGRLGDPVPAPLGAFDFRADGGFGGLWFLPSFEESFERGLAARTLRGKLPQ